MTTVGPDSCQQDHKSFVRGLGFQWVSPEYLLFLGSLLTTAMVNCAKWLHPAAMRRLSMTSCLQLLEIPWRQQQGQQICTDACLAACFALPGCNHSCGTTATTHCPCSLYLAGACHSPPHTRTARGGCTHHSPGGTPGCTCTSTAAAAAPEHESH